MSRRDSQPRVTVAGEVERPQTLYLRDLAALSGDAVTVDFHCLEGWSRPGQGYGGVALATLMHLVQARPAARYVTVGSGGYSIVLTRKEAEDQRVLLALELDGVPLATPRLVGPSEWDCFLSVKDVDRIELTRVPQQATGPAIALTRIGR